MRFTSMSKHRWQSRVMEYLLQKRKIELIYFPLRKVCSQIRSTETLRNVTFFLMRKNHPCSQKQEVKLIYYFPTSETSFSRVLNVADDVA